jgi:hypothetical protein
MDILGKLRTSLILLLVVIILWIGLTLYFNVSSVDMNPNAETYTAPINPSFSRSGFDALTERKDSLPVPPGSFQELVTD